MKHYAGDVEYKRKDGSRRIRIRSTKLSPDYVHSLRFPLSHLFSMNMRRRALQWEWSERSNGVLSEQSDSGIKNSLDS